MIPRHSVSSDDRRFCADFAVGRVPPGAFDHRAHIRLAYIYLAEQDADTALTLMRSALLAFIHHNQVPVANSTEVLFSDEARARFVEPNLELIPRHDG